MTLQYKLRPASSRGQTNIDWLKSYHTFSFGEYWDPRWSNFGSLRVINDDIVAPGKGFPMHGHKDMEIITVVLSGSLAHKDSIGSEAIIPAGSIQLMNAGSGIRHSEYNPSVTEPVHLIQIWIEPATKGTKPSYRDVMLDDTKNSLERILIGEGGVGNIGQDAMVSILNVAVASASIKKELKAGRGHWIHVIEGLLAVDGASLKAGDGIGITEGSYEVTGNGRALFFDVPYHS